MKKLAFFLLSVGCLVTVAYLFLSEAHCVKHGWGIGLVAVLCVGAGILAANLQKHG